MNDTYGDQITLISIAKNKTETADIVETQIERTVFADNGGVKRSEFYAAQTAGFKAEMTFKIRKDEYENEQKIKYDTKGDGNAEDVIELDVIRTYPVSKDDIEIVCKRGVR